MADNPDRTRLLKSKQYLANDDSLTYGSWENIAGRENAHVFAKGEEPALLVIVGQVSSDRISFGPLGSYQTQEEKDYKNSYRIECKDAKFSFYLQKPSDAAYPEWAEDYDDATNNIDALQNTIAMTTGPRLWFLEKTAEQKRVRFVRNIWEKKDFIPDTLDNDITCQNDSGDMDDEYNERKAYAIQKADCTDMYIVPARFKDAFESVAEEHYIDLPPVFSSNGKLIPVSQLAVCLPNAIVEVMFTLRHYLISENKNSQNRATSRNANSAQNSHTFTATFEQIKILHSSNKPKKQAVKKMTTVTVDETVVAHKRKANGNPNAAKGKSGNTNKRGRKTQPDSSSKGESSKTSRTIEEEPIDASGSHGPSSSTTD